ncbi:Phosphotransferase enzyme family protein [Marinovum algicola]|uniref:Phosphotransferase enzyme family protein n=1 Tax=Marinovum algicola TaxID=42444 RepID=A0A975WF26_9RHOB|nr:phosphotransferase [Marinovum algicola]SEK09633.1 Phosphotransferase enzyme family protein [Marinovum algicola]SLN76816.1 Phosphotransferase enzyme family protein [Marinovum algicola]
MDRDDIPLLKALRRAVGDPDARVLSSDRRALGKGFADAMAGGEGLILHSGLLETCAGDQECQVVEKVCRVLPPGREPGSWLYWKREALAYDSGYLHGRFDGIRPPECYGVAYSEDPTARIFIEAIPDAQPHWTAETHSRAANALGRFTASAAGMPDIERHDWMAIGRAHSWTDIAADLLNDPDTLRGDPVLARWLAGTNLARTVDLWQNIGVLRAALADLPKCFCHHDAFQRNLLVRETDEAEPVIFAIDWAFAGHGVVGKELAAAVGASLMFRDIRSDEANDISVRMFSSYLDGMRSIDWPGASADVRLGFCATTAMMFALGALGPWLALLRDPEFSPVVKEITGTEPDRFIGNLSDIQGFFLDLGEEAVELARR